MSVFLKGGSLMRESVTNFIFKKKHLYTMYIMSVRLHMLVQVEIVILNRAGLYNHLIPLTINKNNMRQNYTYFRKIARNARNQIYSLRTN